MWQVIYAMSGRIGQAWGVGGLALSFAKMMERCGLRVIMRHNATRLKTGIVSQSDISPGTNFACACDMPLAAREGVASRFWRAKLL